MDESRIVRKLRDGIARGAIEEAAPDVGKPSGGHELQRRKAAMRPEGRLESTVADTGHRAQAAERDGIGEVRLDPRFDLSQSLDGQHRGRRRGAGSQELVGEPTA
jgi:hypothetical protein